MNKIHYYSLDKSDLLELAKFVIVENCNHHSTGNEKLFDGEIQTIYNEEIGFDNTKIFVARDENYEIAGTIRVLNWNLKDILPIEKLFNIKPNEIDTQNNYDIWHIGRFAIKKGIDKTGFSVFKTLMTCAINEICENENSFALAECDAKLLKIIRLLEIEAITLAKSINYLGSETIPVLLTYRGLKRFLDKNKYLLPQKNYATTL